MDEAVAAGIILVSFVGLLDSLYFLLVTYRWMRPDPTWLPPVCRMDQATCARVVDTPQARLFGIPNSVYGLIWYALTATAGVLLLTRGEIPNCRILALLALLPVAFSLYLAHALIVRLKTFCPLCFLAHGLNFALPVLLTAACT